MCVLACVCEFVCACMLYVCVCAGKQAVQAVRLDAVLGVPVHDIALGKPVFMTLHFTCARTYLGTLYQ